MNELTQDIPNSDDVAGLPRDERMSASKSSGWLWNQFQEAMRMRSRHARSWRMVRAIMQELHYFTVDGLGNIRPLRPDPSGRRIRAVAPIMKPKFRIEMGMLNANQLGVSVRAKMGGGSQRFWKAERGQAILDDWLEAVDGQSIYDEQNQHLAYFGGAMLFRYMEKERRTVCVKATPQTQWFPIPYDAVTMNDCDGIIRAQWVSRQWLEMQDEKAERTGQGQPFRKMAAEKGANIATYDELGPSIGSQAGKDGRGDGALILNTWMKPSQSNGYSGQWMFMVNETMFRHRIGFDEKGRSLALPEVTQEDYSGGLPVEFIPYTKQPDDFYGFGPCEALISMQRERNRQVSYVIRAAKNNKNIMGYDPQSVDSKDIMDEDSLLIPIRSPLEGGKPPMWHFPPAAIGNEVGAVLQLVERFTDQAVNHESGILVGQQEGRTEGGPATSLLNANARAPMQVVIDRVYKAWARTFPRVLDMLKMTWPQQKIVRATGRLHLSREMKISAEDVPWSKDVVITPTPMLTHGRNAMLQMLFSLRQMPSDDGQGFELKSRELRAGLSAMGMKPPGLELYNRAEERIRDHIAELVGDGNTPGVEPSNRMNTPERLMENHPLALEILKEVILDPSFKYYGKAVQQALIAEADFHRDALSPRPPDRFDIDIEDMDARIAENYLLSDENDASDVRGAMALDGIPIGM